MWIRTRTNKCKNNRHHWEPDYSLETWKWKIQRSITECSKIELLNTQILDSTTMTKNKVKETKIAMENKFEEINTNIINIKQSVKKLESK